MSKFLQTHMPTLTRVHKDQHGIVFITVLLVCLLLTFVGMSMATVAIAQLRRTSENVFVSNALLSAEAGIEQSLYELNNTDSFAGYDEVEFYSNSVQGRGTYETTITPGTGPNERVITSIGRTYRDGSSEVLKTRRVRVTIVGTSSPGYSVQAGAGGLILRGSATITNSQIYVNGYIDMVGGGARIGSDSQPLDIFVANANCPTGSNPGPTYPQVCATGQPIRIGDWQNTPVIGNICATGQTQTRFPAAYNHVSGPQIRGGNGGQGLISGCTAPLAPMPTYDRTAHIATMTTTVAGNNVSYDCSQYMPWPSTIGFKRTWPANIRMNGNVNWGSSCELVVSGNAYITGNLDINGGAKIRIADSMGTTRPVIVVDGNINAGAGATVIPNASGTAAHFISFRSSAACTPTCNPFTPMTGNDLKNSQNLTTVRVDGGGGFPGSIFHSYWSKIIIGGSGTLGSAIGQTIDLDGAGTITFGTALSSGQSTWTVRSYQYDYE